MSLCLTFFSLKTKGRHMRVRNYYNLWKTKKTMKRKIKIIFGLITLLIHVFVLKC